MGHNETWDDTLRDFIETPSEMVSFFKEIDDVCKKYGFSISHEDDHGSFAIVPYDEKIIRWLTYASKSY